MSDDEQPPKSPLDFMNSAERAAAEKARLYVLHTAHGTLGTYYILYPEDCPYTPPPRAREDEGRER